MTLSKRLGAGLSVEMLQHCRRLDLHWSLQDAAAADRAGLSLRSGIDLVGLDGLAERLPEHAAQLTSRRQKLVQRCRDGKLDAAGLMIEITRERKVLQGSESGAQRKHLADSRRILTSLLESAVGRVEADVELLPKEVRRRARDWSRRCGRRG